jgi:hypothetical protein
MKWHDGTKNLLISNPSSMFVQLGQKKRGYAHGVRPDLYTRMPNRQGLGSALRHLFFCLSNHYNIHNNTTTNTYYALSKNDVMAHGPKKFTVLGIWNSKNENYICFY